VQDRKIFKTGHNLAVTLSLGILKRLNLKAGDDVKTELSKPNGKLSCGRERPKPVSFEFKTQAQIIHMEIKKFQTLIWNYYKKHKRPLPWRKNINPYRILVSEIMLQQTQVSRVMPKYRLFLKLFPNVQLLAAASLSDVLAAWSGLGYYRRAKFLHTAAKKIVSDFKGKIPGRAAGLRTLPGIGPNTAGAIAAYAYNQPEVFIETNIRKIYLHYFFADREDVYDSELLPIIESTLDKKNPREWYWALMDYGVFLSSQVENPNRRSRHYITQSKFEGSLRQLRAKILKLIVNYKKISLTEIKKLVQDERVETALRQLLEERFIFKKRNVYSIHSDAM